MTHDQLQVSHHRDLLWRFARTSQELLPSTGHLLMEERPGQSAKPVRDFLQ